MKSASTWRRGAVAAAFALPLAVASAGAATAADETPSSSPTDYAPTPGSTVGLAVKSPECDGNVPYLRYAVDVSKDPSATSVDLTWTSLDGAHTFTQTNLPVAGRVLWLGAEESGGKPTAWPGWVFKNGTWEEGGPYTWVRPSVNVTFTVHDDDYTGNASTTSKASFSDGVYRSGTSGATDAGLVLPADNMVSGQVSYPPATTACANPTNVVNTPSGTSTTPGGSSTTPGGSSTTPGKKSLAETGADIAPYAGGAVLLLAAGAVLVLVSRRRRNEPHTD